MKRILLIAVILLHVITSSNVFSQETNRIMVHFELGSSSYLMDQDKEEGDFLFIVTPLYKIGDKTSVGIGAGAKLLGYYEKVGEYEHAYFPGIPVSDSKYVLLGAYPLFVSSMYSFEGHDDNSFFIKGELGYTFFNRDSSWKTSLLYPKEGEVEFRINKRGGFFFSPSVGMLFQMKGKQRVSLSLYCSSDRYSYKRTAPRVNVFETESKNNLLGGVKIGYLF
ncbi:MAG: hypothetical protein LBH72_06760 [Proteiniphilum sp.]|jgi:hypothetical protein|nr:hypothetical protein [Proteiniphilum sp.]